MYNEAIAHIYLILHETFSVSTGSGGSNQDVSVSQMFHVICPHFENKSTKR